jgi:bifunctional DNA-binding transcriptional regulator/antitoxin component of YhaV-PrlF toxin-antitoxin module
LLPRSGLVQSSLSSLKFLLDEAYDILYILEIQKTVFRRFGRLAPFHQDRRISPVMTLLKIQRGYQITLPAALRTAKQLAIGDYLEAVEVPEGILLKPVTVSARDAPVPSAGQDLVPNEAPAPRAGPSALKRYRADD